VLKLRFAFGEVPRQPAQRRLHVSGSGG
jgi:hypothetical protein